MAQQMPDDFGLDYAVYGEALLSFGFEVRDAIDGMGIVTRGLIWHCPQIWIDQQNVAGIVSTWTNASSASSTAWTQASGAGSSTTTTWTNTFTGEC